MSKKFGIRDIVALGICTALFVVLTTVQIPIGIPNTYLQPRMAILAFFAAIFGPIVGGAAGFLGHAIGDAAFYGGVWWSWVIPEIIVGVGIGMFMRKYLVKEGGFATRSRITIFNIVQIASNAIAWIFLAPLFDVLIYKEPKDKVLLQGAFAFLGNIIVIGVLGTLLLVAYTKVMGKSSSLEKEEQ